MMALFRSPHYAVDLLWVGIAFWIVTGIFEFGIKKRAPWPLRVVFWLPGKFLRMMLIVMTLGALSACSNPDPLAVASGPLYQLNAGHWQATPQDLSAPPRVANN